MGAHRAEFEELFRLELDRCVMAARRVVADSAVAEELAAEAFTRAWVRWRRVRRFASPGGWVVRVTTNLALDHVRRGPAPAAATVDTAALDDAIAAHLTLLAAVNQLPDRQREAVSLRYFADLPVDAVAEAMGVSGGAVKTHLHRGLERLRTLLTLEEPDLEARLAPRP
jgi:RNA polymerase sigma factor (sigma-70 family)